MKIVKQKKSLNVENHECFFPSNTFMKHNTLLSDGVKRGIIVGRSGCGKTNALLSLLLHENGLRFSNIYLYSKTLDQPKYQFLKQVLQSLNDGKNKENIGFFEFEEGDHIIPPNEAKPFSIIIFDDVVGCDQKIIRDYYCFGRHYYIDCFYLSQTYSFIPKQLIRDNANFIVLFSQDLTNLVNGDMSFEKFQALCNNCWKDSYDFLVINKDCDLHDGRYRKGFDKYIKI
jgi:hypothetical protein